MAKGQQVEQILFSDLCPGQIVTLFAIDAVDEEYRSFDVEFLGHVAYQARGDKDMKEPVFRFKGKQLNLYLRGGRHNTIPKDGDLVLGGSSGTHFPETTPDNLRSDGIYRGRDFSLERFKGSRMNLFAKKIADIHVGKPREVDLPIALLSEFRRLIIAGEAHV